MCARFPRINEKRAVIDRAYRRTKPLSKIESQRQIESDSVREGCVRWGQNTEYQQATDTKP
jgi:hypothetical protein